MVEQPHYVYTLAYPDEMGGHVFYVGKGMNGRIDEHEKQAKNGVHSHKCHAIRKIWARGFQVVKHKIACFEMELEALQYEIALIFFMRGYEHLTNLADGGKGSSGWTPNEEQLRKMGESHRNSPLAQEQRLRLHSSLKGVKRPPEHFSEEWRRKKSESQKGKPLPEETRRKMSDAHKGKKVHSEEFKQSLAERNRTRIWTDEAREKVAKGGEKRTGKPGTPHTAETKLRLSEIAKQREVTKREKRERNNDIQS